MTVLFQDDFNRANAAIGANWSADAGTVVVSNKAHVGTGGFTAGYAVYATSPSTANYTVQAVITQAELASNGGVGMGIVARFVDTGNFYLAWIDENAVNYRLYRVQSGGYTEIATAWSPGAALSDPVTLQLIVDGSSISVKVNGTTRLTATNSDLTGAGYAGFRVFNAPSIPGHRYDDFIVEDIPAPPTTAIQQRTPVGVTAASGAGFTMPVPTGTVDGDFLVAVIGNASTTNPNAPTGWTKGTTYSPGTLHAATVYTARYSTGLTRSFTNVASAAAALCNAYYWPGKIVTLDVASLGATNSTNNTTMSTGAPTTGLIADDYEALAYSWTTNVTLSGAASGSAIDLTQANSTTLRVAMGRNTNTNLAASTTVTAFSQTLSGASTRKVGIGVLLKAFVYVDLTGTSNGSSPVSGVVTKTSPGFKDLPSVTSSGTSTASATVRKKYNNLTATASGSSSTYGNITGPAVGPQPSRALAINGATESVGLVYNIGATPIATTQPLTIAFWCKVIAASPGHGNVVTLTNPSATSEVGYWIPDHRPRIFQGSVMIAQVQTDVLSPMFEYGDWHHIVFSRDDPSGVFRGYMDGVPFPNETGTTPSPNGILADVAYLIVGAPAQYFQGAISQLRLWNARLSAVEIAAEMNSPTAVRTANLYGNWLLDGTLLDTAGNNRHLAGIGGPVAGAVTYTGGPGAGLLPNVSASGTSSTTATVTRTRPLTASASSVSTVSVQLSSKKSLGVLTSSGSSTASGVISVKQALSATSSGISTVSATATGKRALVVTSSGSSTATGVISRKRTLTATSSGISTAAAQTIRKRALAATSVGTSSTTATPNARRVLVATATGFALTTGTVQKLGATAFPGARAQGTAEKLTAEIRAGAVFNAALATATAQKLAAGTASGTAFPATLATATAQSTVASISAGFRFSAELATAAAQSLVAQIQTGTVFSGVLASATAQKYAITIGTGTTFPGTLATANALSSIATIKLSTGLQAQLMLSSASALDSTMRSGVVLPAQVASASTQSLNAIMRISTGILAAVAIGSASASQVSILAGIRIIAESMTAGVQSYPLSLSSTGLFLAQRMQASGDLKSASIYLGKIWPAVVMAANAQSHVITHITGGTWSARLWVVNGQLRIAVIKESFGITSPGPDIIYADNVLPVIVESTYLVPYLYNKGEMVPNIVGSDEV